MAETIQNEDELGQSNLNQPGQQNNNANQAGQAPVQSQTQAPTITSNQVSNPNQQKGSGFTNIQKVIGANQGNKLGEAVGNNIQQVGNAAQDNLRNAQSQFNQQSQANQFNTDANNQLVQNVLNDPTQYTTNDQNNPNSGQGNQFKTLISGQYQGPQTLNNANQIQAQSQNLAQMGQALGTSGGRQGLLQQIVGNPQYTAGQQNLDNLLLGQSNDPAIQAAKRQALTMQGKTNNALAGAQAQGSVNINQAQQFGQNVQDQFGNAVAAQDTNLQKQATDAQTARDAQYQQTLNDLKSGNVSQQEADQLGLSQGENVYNLLNDPSKFVQESPLKANAQNVASSNDYARLNALQQLSGGFGPQGAKDILGQYQDPTQAGKFQADQAMTGNKDDFNTQLGATDANYHSIFDPVQAQAAQAKQIYDYASGIVSPAEQQDYINRHPNAAGWGTQTIGQALIGEKFPGAQANGGTRMDWATSNIDSAIAARAAAIKNLQAQYGTPTTINIGNNPQNPADLENMPKVT